jgi:hypothetical protein
VVSIHRGGHDEYPARDAGAMASRRFPPLLALDRKRRGESSWGHVRGLLVMAQLRKVEDGSVL